MKNILKAAYRGVSLSAVVFLLTSIIKGFEGGAESFASGTGMAHMCIAAIAIGIGFGIPSIIYETELPAGLKVLIHMGTGIAVMLVTSVLIGWIDFSSGWLPCLIIIAVQIAIAFVLWTLISVRTRRDAKQMNERLAQKQ